MDLASRFVIKATDGVEPLDASHFQVSCEADVEFDFPIRNGTGA